MKVACIMPTGARPEAFALIVRYMQRQSFTDWHWWIIDDCDPATPAPDDPRVTMLRAPWRWKSAINTQARCMIALIDVILPAQPDFTLVIEDDEWYAPNYIAEMVSRFVESRKAIIGQTRAHFYNVRQRQARLLDNVEHTALCRTGVSLEGLRVMREVFSEQLPPKIVHDRLLWLRMPAETRLLFDAPAPLNIGIKGMPGRFGIGTGHDRIKREPMADPTLRVLRRWIGADAHHYARFYKHTKVIR